MKRKEDKFRDDTLLKIRRKYNNDEVISALYSQNDDLKHKLKEANQLIGQLKSELDHLNFLFEKVENKYDTVEGIPGVIKSRKHLLKECKALNRKLSKL